MSTKIVSIISVLFFLLLSPLQVLAAPLSSVEIPPETLTYLQAQQQTDGGLPGLAGTSDPSTTARALLAFQGLGLDPVLLTNSAGISASQYLIENYTISAYDGEGLLFPGSAGLILAALPQIDGQPNPLAAEILAAMQADGSFTTAASSDFVSGAASASNQIFSILGLSAAGLEIAPEAVQYLLDLQLEDGTWDNGFGSDPDTTAVAVVALLSSGQVASDNPAIVKALDYFRITQLDNAGWRPGWDTSELNVDTSGWISLALVTAGQEMANWAKNGQTPVDSILTQLQPDGSIGGEYVNVYSTVEALLGLAISPLFPVTSAPETSVPVESKAALVVTLADGSSLLRCVTFEGESISGMDLLTASGLTLEIATDPVRGMAICSIEGEGCPRSNCFCDMPNYWSYWHWQDGTWNYATSGTGSYDVTNGSLEGWTYSDGIEPPQVSFEQICSAQPLLFLPAIVVEDSSTMAPTAQSTQFLMLPAITSPEAPAKEFPINTILYAVFGLMIISIVLLTISRKKNS